MGLPKLDDQINWTDVQTKGFTVIPNFLNDEEVEELLREFNTLPMSENKNYPLKTTSKKPFSVREKLLNAANELSKTTDVHCDFLFEKGLYFATELGVNFPWHQDHESFYLCQNHYNYLNFWIPISKPNREKSNLCLIPFDALEKRDPQFARTVKGQGACFFKVKNGKTFFRSDDTGKTAVLPFSLDELGYCPYVSAGDLVLVRGDAIHKTQDAATGRIAISYRMANSQRILSKKNLLPMCTAKFIMMLLNKHTYGLYLDCWERSGKNEMALSDFMSLMKNVSGEPYSKTSTLRFLRTLYRHWMSVKMGSRG